MKKSIFILLGLVALFSVYSPRISSSNPNFKVERPEILQRGYQYPIYIHGGVPDQYPVLLHDFIRAPTAFDIIRVWCISNQGKDPYDYKLYFYGKEGFWEGKLVNIPYAMPINDMNYRLYSYSHVYVIEKQFHDSNM